MRARFVSVVVHVLVRGRMGLRMRQLPSGCADPFTFILSISSFPAHFQQIFSLVFHSFLYA